MKRLRLWWAKRKLAKGLREMDLTGTLELITSAPLESNVTRWIEESVGYDALAWECETCGWMTQLDGSPEEHDYNFCPRCGRKITEFVPHKEGADA